MKKRAIGTIVGIGAGVFTIAGVIAANNWHPITAAALEEHADQDDHEHSEIMLLILYSDLRVLKSDLEAVLFDIQQNPNSLGLRQDKADLETNIEILRGQIAEANQTSRRKKGN